ncbi:ATP-dependent RNA helicase HrpB [Proteus mirabilis]|uniref:ATP-dependent RNA helicase HrpB n=1 Tax=Proteus mirabilis TaxID=584 RepID=A0A2X2BX80_PROMI|nr:ATP-dependent RNA helicase HrpB [Proteus mirabilis]
MQKIIKVAQLLADKVDKHTLIFPLYGALSLAQQQQAIEPVEKGYRKVVLATNIAENQFNNRRYSLGARQYH